jgi:hypothetical protein
VKRYFFSEVKDAEMDIREKEEIAPQLERATYLGGIFLCTAYYLGCMAAKCICINQ